MVAAAERDGRELAALARVRLADALHRTAAAVPETRGADEGAELHERLVVRPRGAAGARQDGLGDRPQLLLTGAALDVDVGRETSIGSPMRSPTGAANQTARCPPTQPL